MSVQEEEEEEEEAPALTPCLPSDPKTFVPTAETISVQDLT